VRLTFALGGYMEWYKHSTSSHDDPDISDAMDEFGHAAYAVFFIILEVYGDEYNHLDSEGWLRLSSRFIQRKLRLSSTKVQLILNFYSERQRVLVKYEGSNLLINCPKFIDIASNWVKRKSTQPTEGLQRAYIAPTAIEVEEEKKKKDTSLFSSTENPVKDSCPHKAIIMFYHQNLPSCPQIVKWTDTRASHLRARWNEDKERQNVEWWEWLFQQVAQSKFLTGRITGKNQRPFFASLDWIVKPENMTKILEGRYHE
jgi:hypothetical protein